MDAGTLAIKNIFGQDRRHIVPLFQRPYVWNQEDQWEPLWDDIRSVGERALRNEEPIPHFLGAIVLDQLKKPTGHIETRWVIDGQQRLTTIQLFLEAFADICEEQGLERHYRALRKLTRNDDPMSEDKDEEFKVWPTNVDQNHFRRVMRAKNPNHVKSEYGVRSDTRRIGSQMADGYLFFFEELSEWLAPTDDDLEIRVDALYSAVREHLRMVVIDLSKEDDAQLIFETLNARGTPLLPSDLVKNHLFHKAKLEARNLDVLYDQHWKHFDVDESYWRQELGRGHARRARIDWFLQYYLGARTASDVSVGRLYTSFRDFADNGVSSLEHLTQLTEYANIYRRLDSMGDGTREGIFMKRLAITGALTAYPFLLELFAREDIGRDERLTILNDLESFLIRRMIGRLNTRNYSRMFVDMVGVIKDSESPSETIRDFLQKGDTDSNRWPDDREFEALWLNEPAYRNLAQTRIRMILEGIESELRSTKSEHIEFRQQLTIEHLMPQQWREHWPIDGSAEDIEKRDRQIHAFGNLTLLTNALNPAVSNGPWSEKRTKILEHSALALNRGFQNVEVWDEDEIRRRGSELLSVARQLWPYPKS